MKTYGFDIWSNSTQKSVYTTVNANSQEEAESIVRTWMEENDYILAVYTNVIEEVTIRIYVLASFNDGFISNFEALSNGVDVTKLPLAKIADLQAYANKEPWNAWGEQIECAEGRYSYDYDTRRYTRA